MSANKADMKRRLHLWLIAKVDKLESFSYDEYVGDMYDIGLAPMTRQEFTYWMWFFNDTYRINGDVYNQVSGFFTGHDEWTIKKYTYTDWQGTFTVYDWVVRD